jgi:hypothetical protein
MLVVASGSHQNLNVMLCEAEHFTSFQSICNSVDFIGTEFIFKQSSPAADAPRRQQVGTASQVTTGSFAAAWTML